jgi:hypothetical protein
LEYAIPYLMFFTIIVLWVGTSRAQLAAIIREGALTKLRIAWVVLSVFWIVFGAGALHMAIKAWDEAPLFIILLLFGVAACTIFGGCLALLRRF